MKGISKHIFYYISNQPSSCLVDLINLDFLFSCECTPWKKKIQLNRLGHSSGGGLVGCYNFQHMWYIFPQRCPSKWLILKLIRCNVLGKCFLNSKTVFLNTLRHGIFCERILLMENSKQTFIHILDCDDIANFIFWWN